jgi:hypothetical protein
MTDYATTQDTFHQQLAGTAADRVTIGDVTQGRRFAALEVYNRSLTDELWFSYAVNDTVPLVASPGLAGTYYLPPDSALPIDIAVHRCTRFSVSLDGNSNLYSVHGLPA